MSEVCQHPFNRVNDAGTCIDCGTALTIKVEPPSPLELRIDRLAEKWEWVIGGVVGNDPRYVRAIIYDFLNVPLPDHTYHSRDGMMDAERERKKAY